MSDIEAFLDLLRAAEELAPDDGSKRAVRGAIDLIEGQNCEDPCDAHFHEPRWEEPHLEIRLHLDDDPIVPEYSWPTDAEVPANITAILNGSEMKRLIEQMNKGAVLDPESTMVSLHGHVRIFLRWPQSGDHCQISSVLARSLASNDRTCAEPGYCSACDE